MPAKPQTLDALCARCRNENMHTEHVAALAERLFDIAAKRIPFTPADRRLLDAAARLHDIGYASRPDDHVREGARLILSRGIAGYRRDRWPLIAGIALLHSGDYVPYPEHAVFRNPRTRKRIMRLAAILRIADGLDHGHLQDVDILRGQWNRKGLTLSIRVGAFAGNVAKARLKADLWQTVMPGDIRFAASGPAARKTRIAPLHRRHNALEAARRLLHVQYRLAQQAVPGAIAGKQPEPLHDLRVAIRRYRSVLRLFRPLLRDTPARELDGTLRDVNRTLGACRDHDVWLQFLRTSDVAAALARDTAWPAYRDRLRTERLAAAAALARYMGGPVFRQALRGMAFLNRIQIPALMRTQPTPRARLFAARRLRRLFRHVLSQTDVRASGDPEAMHRLRCLCRRERYWAEFGAPLLGADIASLARRLKALADALGSLHDRDVAAARLARERDAPRCLLAIIAEDRRRAVAACDRAWSRLHAKAWRKRTLDTLHAAHGKK